MSRGGARRAQLAIEFVAATMIFLFATVLVISAVFRAYNQAADDRKSELLRLNAEKFSEALLRSSDNGFAEADGSLNYTKIAEIPAGNYTRLREIVRTRDDYLFSASYLPSLLIDYFFENALSKSPGSSVQGQPFDSFSNATPIRLSVFPRSLSGGIAAADTFVLLINQSDSLVDMQRVSAPESHVKLTATYEGIYTLRFLSYNGAEFAFGQKEVSIGVVK